MQQAVLEDAFDAYRTRVATIAESGDWGTLDPEGAAYLSAVGL